MKDFATFTGFVGAIVGISLIFLFVSCGGDEFQRQKIGDGYAVVEIPYQGSTLRCVKMHFASGTSAQWGGLSCDFVDYWKGH